MGLGRAGPVLGHGAQRICRGAALPDPVSLQLVTACAMQAFYSLFSAQPGPSCLPAQLNAQIITVSAGCCGGEGRGCCRCRRRPSQRPSAPPGAVRLRAQRQRPAAAAHLAVHHGEGARQPVQVGRGRGWGRAGERLSSVSPASRPSPGCRRSCAGLTCPGSSRLP